MSKSRNLVEILITAKNLAGPEIKKAEGQLGKLQKQILKTSGAMAAAGKLVSLALFSIAANTAKTADEYRKFERATGIQVNTLAGLRFAIQRWGGTQRDADTALRRLTKAIADGASGLESYVRVWRRLNITTEDLINPETGNLVSVQDILPIIADRFRVLTDATLKADAAQILFGRGGLRLIPLLNQGAEGMQRMADRAERLGRFFSTDTLDAAEQFQDAMLDVRHSVQGVGFAIGKQLMPGITSITNIITEHVISLRLWFERNGELVKSIASMAAGIGGAAGVVFMLTSFAFAIKVVAFALGGMTPVVLAIAAAIGLFGWQLSKIKIIEAFADRPIEKVAEELAAANKELEIAEKRARLMNELFKTDKRQDLPGAVPTKAVREYAGWTKEAREQLEKAREAVAKLTKEHAGLIHQKEREIALEEQKVLFADLQAMRATAAAAELADLDSSFQLELARGTKSAADEVERLEKKSAILGDRFELLQEIVSRHTGDQERYKTALDAAVAAGDEYNGVLLVLLKLNQRIRDEIEVERIEAQTEALKRQTEFFEARYEMLADGVTAASHRMVAAMGLAQSALGSGLQGAMSRVLQEGNKWRDSWNALWRGMVNTVISAVAQMIARIIVMKLAMSFFGGSFFNPALLMQGASGLAVAVGASGGEVVRGRRGRDDQPALLQRGENVLDASSNDRLNSFLDGVEEGGMGGGNVIIYAGLYTGTKQENKVFQDFQRRSSAGFERRHIARGMR